MEANCSMAPFLELVRNHRMARQHEIIGELREFLSLPNMETDRRSMRRNANFIGSMMKRRGIEPKFFETSKNPIIWGDFITPDATETLTFYSHYDGVPVDEAEWTDSSPFSPVYRRTKLDKVTREPRPEAFPSIAECYDNEARIYARSASDDKGPIVALFAALDAAVSSGRLSYNIRFVFEGQEESGSRDFAEFARNVKAISESSAFFICDGPAYFNGDLAVWFGVRGTVFLDVTVFGANTILHAGHFTNFAPSAAERLAHLLASMTTLDGRVAVEGFYGAELAGEEERRALKAAPAFDHQLKELYGFSREVGHNVSYLEALQLPGFNVTGLRSGWVGDEARYIVPPMATATIMLLPDQSAEAAYFIGIIEEHIRKQGYLVVSEDPDHKTRMQNPLIAKVSLSSEWNASAARTPMDAPIAKRIVETIKRNSGQRAVFVPCMGSTIGIFAVLRNELGIPTVLVSTVNQDNNQHGPDENIRVGNFWNAIDAFAALMIMDT